MTLYCFKHLKIMLLWQKPTNRKKFNAGFVFISEEYILKYSDLVKKRD